MQEAVHVGEVVACTQPYGGEPFVVEVVRRQQGLVGRRLGGAEDGIGRVR